MTKHSMVAHLRTAHAALAVIIIVSIAGCSYAPVDGTVEDVRLYLDRTDQLDQENLAIAARFRSALIVADREEKVHRVRTLSAAMTDVIYTMRVTVPPPHLRDYHSQLLMAWSAHKDYLDESDRYLTSGGSLDELSRLYATYIGAERTAYRIYNEYARDSRLHPKDLRALSE